MFVLKLIFFKAIIFSFVSFLAVNTQAYYLPDGYKDFSSVDEAVSQVQNRLRNQGYEISLVVNHAAAAESVGLTLRPTQVIFARQAKHIERRMLHRSKTLAIDLPLKFLVFEDEAGVIQILYNSVGYLIDRHRAWFFDPLWNNVRKRSEQFDRSEQGLITIVSNFSVDETVGALQQAIGDVPAFRIPLVLDFCDRGRTHCPKLIVFGNPNAGTPLMQANQEIGIDLPQKFLVWQGRDRQVYISYNDPIFLAERHNIQGQDGRLTAIANALANFAKQGAGNPL